MKPEINDIVTIKLDNGEELVGQLIEQTDEAIKLANPMKIATPDDVAAALNAFVASVNASIQSGLGQAQTMMATVNDSGLDTAHSHVSDIVTNMPSSATMISKANEIGASVGMPPSPPLDSIFDPVVNGGLNNTFAPVKSSMDGIHTAVTGTISDSINGMINAAQYVFDSSKTSMTRSGLSFHAPTKEHVQFSLSTLSVHFANDDIIHDYLHATK